MALLLALPLAWFGALAAQVPGDGEPPRPAPAPLEVLAGHGARSLARAGAVLVAAQPTLDTVKELAREGVKLVVDLRPESARGEEPTAAQVEALGPGSRAFPVGGADALTDALLDDVRGLLAHARREPASGAVLLFDASGDAAAAVWLAARALDEGVAWETALGEAHRAGLHAGELEDVVRAHVLGAGRQELGRWKERIRVELPDVKGVSVDALAATLGREGPRPLLLDARAPAEFAVSHLRGARSTPDVDAALAQLAGEPKEREVVVYCSIGYRSARLAHALGEHGFTHVRNLEGSIFEWANTGHPVYRGDAPVREVHPYDRTWGRMLERALWSWGPR